MNQLFESRPLLKTGILGLLLLPFLVLINDFSPPESKIPEGYSSAILAFEFASNKDELIEVLDPLSSNELADLDRLNYVDFGFMVMYGIFIFLFMSRLSQLTNDHILKKARWLIPIAVMSDALENIQLLKLSERFLNDLTGTENILVMLALFTWTKWLLLSAALFFIGYILSQQKRLRWMGYFLFVPIILGIWAFLSNQRSSEDLFGTSIFMAFFIVFLYSLIYRREYSPKK